MLGGLFNRKDSSAVNLSLHDDAHYFLPGPAFLREQMKLACT